VSVDTTFKPTGPAILVGTSPVQIQVGGNQGSIGDAVYVRCLAAAASSAYFFYGPSAAALASLPTVPPTGATGATSAPNALGMFGQTVKVFQIPSNSFVVASAAGAFEMVPGVGGN
jgi:hypothetical protein